MYSCFLLSVVCAHLLNFEHAGIFGGVDLGYYYVDLSVGSPPAKQTVIVDTGSSLTAFPCAGCQNCGKHLDSYFDYRHSNTSRLVTCTEDVPCSSCQSDHCNYHQGYAEGSSIAGFLVEDYVSLGDDETAERAKLVFGCHEMETNLFRTQQADGIMGLAFAQEGSKRMTTIVDVLYKNHEISTDIFALCLGQTDGYMTVGGYNSSLHRGAMSFAHLHHSIYYAVNLKGMFMGAHRVDVRTEQFGSMYGGVGTIVDSGTTFVYLRNVVYERLWKAFEDHCSYRDQCKGEAVAVPGETHSCYRFKKGNITEFYASFPVIHMEMDDIIVDWEPDRYLFTWTDHPNDYCLGVYSNGGGGNVLGGLFMRGMDIVFDRTTDTIGFAKADCNASYLLTGGRRDVIASPRPSYTDHDIREDRKTGFSLWTVGLVVGLAVLVVLGTVGVFLWIRRKKPSLLVSDAVVSKPGWTEVQVNPISS